MYMNRSRAREPPASRGQPSSSSSKDKKLGPAVLLTQISGIAGGGLISTEWRGVVKRGELAGGRGTGLEFRFRGTGREMGAPKRGAEEWER